MCLDFFYKLKYEVGEVGLYNISNTNIIPSYLASIKYIVRYEMIKWKYKNEYLEKIIFY